MGLKKASRADLAGWACSFALLVCIIVIRPCAEIGLHDDWSYIYSAKRLAETGHVVYNGWATAMLGWQLYLGAAFIRLFGFSFTVVRAAAVLVAALIAPLLQSIFLRLGIRPWNATLGTLTFVLSPLFLPLSATYMSDVPALLSVFVCLYMCLRALEATNDETSVRWIIAAALVNVASGTVRQIAWLGVLVMVPSTAWFLRRRRGMLYAAGSVWLVSGICIALLMHWFQTQPYSSIEKTFALALNGPSLKLRAVMLVKSFLSVAIFSLPILAGIAWQMRQRTKAHTILASGLAIGAAFAVVLVSVTHPEVRWMTMLAGDYVSPKGILDLPWLLGPTQDVVSPWAQAGVAIVVFAVILTAIPAILPRILRSSFTETYWGSWFFWLVAPFTLAYLSMIATRAALFDRYLLPLIAIVLMWLLRLHATRRGERLPIFCLVLILLGAAYGVAGSHDMFASARARLQAAEVLIARGIARNEFRAGFEYDGWTQIEQRG